MDRPRVEVAKPHDKNNVLRELCIRKDILFVMEEEQRNSDLEVLAEN